MLDLAQDLCAPLRWHAAAHLLTYLQKRYHSHRFTAAPPLSLHRLATRLEHHAPALDRECRILIERLHLYLLEQV